jgi:hypothetical protein
MIGTSSCSDIPKAGKSILSSVVTLVLLYDFFTRFGNNVSFKIDRILSLPDMDISRTTYQLAQSHAIDSNLIRSTNIYK